MILQFSAVNDPSSKKMFQIPKVSFECRLVTIKSLHHCCLPIEYLNSKSFHILLMPQMVLTIYRHVPL